MPFTFKLSQRLALMKAPLALAAAAAVLVACDLTKPTGPPSPPNLIVQLVSSPDTVTLIPYQTRQFRAFGRTQHGDSVAAVVSWTSTGGTVSSSGLYTAGPMPGLYGVTASAPSAVANVTVSSKSTVRNRGRLEWIVLAPGTAALLTGQAQQFAAYGRTTAGDSVPVSVTYSVTGGTISAAGLYTAGQSAGAYQVVATESGGSVAGTARITINTVPVAAVTVNPPTGTVPVGGAVQLSATPKDVNGVALTGRVVTWASSNTAVATVSASGLLTGVAAGSATITATSEGINGTSAITVANVPVASVTVSPAATSLLVGATQQLSATPKDVNGVTLTGRVVTWASSNTAVATVSASGLVTGVAAGSATITATSEGINGTSAITVANVPVASVTVSPTTAGLLINATRQLSAVTKDAAGATLSGRVVTWSSSAPAVATVSASGLVTGVAAGSATITATSEGKSGTATVTVTNVPVASVTLSPAIASVLVGTTLQLTATPKDSAGGTLSGRVVTWASSAPALAMVDGSGLITTLAVGSVTITATSEGKTGTARITVGALSSGVVYVSPAGSDAVSCAQAQNIATPKQTLNNAVACLTPGTTLLVRGGTYAEALLDNIPSGTSWTAPVTIRAYPGEAVMLKPNTGTTWVVHFQNPQAYIVLDGLILDATNVTYDCVKITYSSVPTVVANHIRIMNGEIRNVPSHPGSTNGQPQGLLDDGSNNEFINLKVHDNGGAVGSTNFGHGIYMHGSNSLVDGCDIYNNAAWGLQFYATTGGVNNNIIRNTKIHGNNKGLAIASGDGNAAYNNLIYGNVAEGLHLDYGATNTFVYNNTIYQNGTGILNGSGSSGAVVSDNIAYQTGAAYTNTGTATVDHNLFNVDPMFVNAAGGDFRLLVGSPAINAGITIAMVPTDIVGVPRPHGIAYCLGAYEF